MSNRYQIDALKKIVLEETFERKIPIKRFSVTIEFGNSSDLGT